ncbi:MAG: TolC family protein [Bacteroidales bacterium]|jgi:outer membrane protein TolC|nr:TolC family protein [Bacteroidales bacterium]
MKPSIKKCFFSGIILLSSIVASFSQGLTPYKISLGEAVEMGLQNHQQLKIAKVNVETSEQQVKVSKSQQLPTVTFSANAFYLGDALLLNPDWSKLQTVSMPHFGNSFAVQASQLLYKGGVIKKSIEMAELQQQLAELDMIVNEQDIKFLIISNYLDIYTTINQAHILEQNKILAEQLYDNIKKSYKEDMVTRNELIRAELQIKNLDQAILTMQNNHAILSNQLSYALGLPGDILIVPTEDTEAKAAAIQQDHYMDLAHEQHPTLRSAGKNVEIAEKNISITKANQFPAISAFGGYNMQRPVTTSTPVMDLYNNSWQIGISFTYNIDNLFKSKRRVNLSRMQARATQEALAYTRQNVEIGVNTAFLKYREAEQQVLLMSESKKLANENYEIVRAKYLNQLAITAEMTDASNAKLDAELQYANASINALFQYYNLLKSTGTL